MGEKADRHPRAESGDHDSTYSVGTSLHQAADNVTRQYGCSCGCRTRPPYIDDPDCVRHQPVPELREQPDYDVQTLGLVPHDRARCPHCQAVGK